MQRCKTRTEESNGLPCCANSSITVCLCVLRLCVVQGHHAVAEMWQKSGLQWSEFLSDADKVDEFLAKHVSCHLLF